MNRKFILIVSLFALCSTTLFGQIQSREVTDKFYPNPDIKFSTPTLSIGEDRFATYPEIMNWINERDQINERMSVEMIGVSAGGKQIPMIKLSNGKDTPHKKVKVWMQGAIHGNEPAGAEGLFMIVDYILNNDAGSKLLDKIDLYILPMANIDGYFADKRVSAGGLDLNRDQTKFGDAQSVLIKNAFINVNPDVAIDFHEFSPIRKEVSSIGAKGGAIYYDVLFLPTGYPNVPKVIRDANIKFLQTPAEKELDKVGYTHFYYFSINNVGDEFILAKGAKSPQSSSTSYSLSNAISILVEIRGIKFGRLSLERRTNSVFIVAKSALDQVYNNDKSILKIVNKAIKQTIKGKEPISVTGVSKEYSSSVTFVDLAENQLIEKDVIVKDALYYKNTLVRERPLGYLIESSQSKAVENLRTLGVNVQKIEQDCTMEVEGYKIVELSHAKKSWEKINRATVKTEIVKQKMEVAKGYYWVPLNQENANFAVSVLEPESENGFVTFRVIEAKQGEFLPVYRVINN